MKLGDFYRQQSEYDEAITQYKEAISIQPKYFQVMHRLVLIYSERQHYTNALDVLQNMRQLQPENPEVYYNIACIYAKQDKADESISWLKQAVEKGFSNWDLIMKDPDLVNIRDTAIIHNLIKKYKKPS